MTHKLLIMTKGLEIQKVVMMVNVNEYKGGFNVR
jgi:hypothetical protein